MKNPLKNWSLTAGILALVVCSASASFAASLHVGGLYASIPSVVNGTPAYEGGGSISNSTLDGRPLDYLFCVDLFTNVYANSDYQYTTTNNSGMIHGSEINGLGEVAWLLEHYAVGGQGDQAIALQADIWEVINGYSNYHLDVDKASSSIVGLYKRMLTAGAEKTGNVSNFIWINPQTDLTGKQKYQGLVTNAPVPEPATMILLGTGLLGLAGIARRRTR